MKKATAFIPILLLCLPLSATNYTVKAGGGGSFPTLAGCAAQMVTNGSGVSDTCTVFAGTYTESITIPAGTSGNLKIFNVNGADTVSVVGAITLSSFTQLNGNCPETQGTVITTASCGFFLSRTASPTSDCITVPASTTNFQVLDVQMYACNSFTVPSTASFGHIRGLTVAYPETTVANMPANGAGSLGVAPAIRDSASHMLYEYIDISHVSDGFASFFGQNKVIRRSYMHDISTTDCDAGAHSSNCHIDFMESEPTFASGNYVFEFNQEVKAPGINIHSWLTQGDVCGGNCAQAIIRNHIGVHVGGPFLLDDLGGFTAVHTYNNTAADYNATSVGGQFTLDFKGNSINGAVKNNIYYYPSGNPVDVFTSAFNPYACETQSGTDTSCTGGKGFAFANNLAYCAGTGCKSGGVGAPGSTLKGHQYNTGSWTSEPGHLYADPLFVGYSSSGLGDLHLTSGSPARNAGTFLTTVNGSISSSTALVVTDAGYFQDGMTISGVQGDCISVTTVGNHVCITAVNYATNTLTLASPITATNGDSVWLYSISDGTQVLTGTAPDMGALPFNVVVASAALVTTQAVVIPRMSAAQSAFVTLSAATTTQLLAAPTIGTLYVTAVQLNTRTAGTASAIQIVAGTGTNCATNQFALTPAYANTAAGVLRFVFKSPLVPPRVNAICAIQTGTTPGTTDVLVNGFNAP